jgi:hypothetical protein
VSYLSDFEMDDYTNLASAKLLNIIGHSEYWTRQARINFDRFVSEGKNVLILSGNTMYWQVRYSEDKNQLICYRDADQDPEPNPLLKTVSWNTPFLRFPIISSIGADFDHGGYGRDSIAQGGWNGYKIVSNNSPLLEGLGLNAGDILSLPTVEYDGVPIASFNSNGYPIINTAALGFWKSEIIGFNPTTRNGIKTAGTFAALQKTTTSGKIINVGSTDWCGMKAVDGNPTLRALTLQMIQKLLRNEEIFSP